ncbi:methylenetetrahydrofolate reductase (NADPH) [Monaibacterium marinum]|uniref:Methylenetetrahydrofolate reductase (NADPH) n=1 Tax=Pontivivens marinum TaxID=1690039 RepID=A0A2C9CRX2_9RHOB|nr:5,10-methylenetetrahydrofolate reductase [Monaibacterium marinum]SOH93953.1 methylenetetrahydrofolate reductase (NADPH) [Monaibacterium marinum]
MSNILSFMRRKPASTAGDPSIASFLNGFSIEVMPRTAEKIEDFRAILPQSTRVYIAHIDGTPIEDMVATAARLTDQGFTAMPHFPARIIADKATLAEWISRYADIGVNQGLLIAGGVTEPRGDFHCSMDLLETGLFDAAGFDRLHVGGHPEGNKDIDPDGSDRNVMDALRWKQKFSDRTDAKMAVATQFCFEAQPVIEWADRLQAEGIDLPIHIGVAGPAKLQTLIKFSLACGVGASLRVLQRRAADLTKLVLPFTPDEFLADLARHKATHPGFGVESVHLFPLGGIKKTAEYTDLHGQPAAHVANA